MPVETENSLGMKLRLIPPGSFMRGTDDAIAGIRHKPRHRITMTKPYYICSTETTVAQYRQFVDETGYVTTAELGAHGGGYLVSAQGRTTNSNRNFKFPGFDRDDDHPATYISWLDAAAHWMLTGRHGSTSVNKEQMFPSVGSFVARVKGANQPGMPPYVGLPAAHSVYIYPGYQGAAYLGSAYNPFQVNNQQRYLGATYTTVIKPPEVLANIQKSDKQRSASRLGLLERLDVIRRDIDQSGLMDSMDHSQQQAMDLISSPQARQALDISKEDPRLRDKYGRNPWGHYTLMARRMVEAGVSFVTVDMPHWDDHSRIEKGHGPKLKVVDQAVAALLDDLELRGMLDDVLLVVMGEFGRTPKLNNGQPGIPIPGRDHGATRSARCSPAEVSKAARSSARRTAKPNIPSDEP